MPHRLPPLNALRAFEVAGRYLSFTRAAEELHVTQAAISHQIKTLEDHLGIRLFQRRPRKLLLTEAGQTLLPVLYEAFKQISETIEGLSETIEGNILTVSLRPYFAAKWLTPRLGRFWQQHASIHLRLHHTIQAIDFVREDVDMAVWWGRGDWRNVQSEVLLNAELSPVCSPALLTGVHALYTSADLRYHTLLHEENYFDWSQWLAKAGVHDVDLHHGLIIDDSNVRLQAAIDGQGVALGCFPLISDDIAAGKLVRLFDLSLDEFAYYIVYPVGALNNTKVKAFRNWLLEEVDATTTTA